MIPSTFQALADFPRKEFVGPANGPAAELVRSATYECLPYPEAPRMNVEKNGKVTRYFRKKKTMFDMCTSKMRNKHIYSHVYFKIYFPWEDVLIERCWKISSQAKLFGRTQDPLGVFFDEGGWVFFLGPHQWDSTSLWTLSLLLFVWAPARRSTCMKTWSVPLASLQAKTIQVLIHDSCTQSD